MKKRLLVITALTAFSLTVGCAVEKDMSVSNINDSFNGSIQVESDGKQYECELLHTPEKVSVIKILKPDSLSGLTFSWENDKYNVAWKELSCEFNKEFIPDCSFMSNIVSVMNALHQKELLKNLPDDSDDNIYMGNCEAGEFKAIFNKDVSLKQINIDEKNIHVKMT